MSHRVPDNQDAAARPPERPLSQEPAGAHEAPRADDLPKSAPFMTIDPSKGAEASAPAVPAAPAAASPAETQPAKPQRDQSPQNSEKSSKSPVSSNKPSAQKPARPRGFASRLLRFFGWLFAFCAAFAAAAGLLFWWWTAELAREPAPPLLDGVPFSTAYYSDDGRLLRLSPASDGIFRLKTPLSGIAKEAVIATVFYEDRYFRKHPGVNPFALVRAAFATFTGSRPIGASTITMQVARNFFLSSERTYTRKLYEVAMAYKIERHLTKDQILEVYLNQIYLGQRAYGFAAAAQVYFGKKLNELTIGEAATIAGLPVAPSAYNPIVNPKRATMRKNYVLSRMHQLQYIDDITYEAEVNAPLMPVKRSVDLTKETPENEKTIHAEYAAEMARMLVYDIFREETYTRGLNVYTTIRDKDQLAAWEAVRKHLIAYDRKYRYRGPSGRIDISDEQTRDDSIRLALHKAKSSDNLEPAVVTELTDKTFKVVVLDGKELKTLDLDADSRKFAGKYLTNKVAKEKRLQVGSIIRVSRVKKGWTLSQIPEVQAGFISVDFDTGAVKSLVGGFDFYLNMFNHVTQALRQPGSSFKPFIYSAALDKGFNPGTIINDAPIFIDPRLTGGELWEPRNYDNKFDGPMSLAMALRKSKNLVSIRVMQAIGARYAQEYVSKFGFDPSRTPAQLTTALGAGSTTPWEMAAAFSVFANGGYRVKPYLINKVTDVDGKVLMRVNNPKAGNEAIRAIDERNAFVMHTLLNGVVSGPGGTARRAYRELKRPDMGGKTGTSNNAHDAWFAGYASHTMAVGWVGYDQMRPLGSTETGGGLVLPIWIDYMKTAIKDEPPYRRRQPSSVVLLNGTYYYADSVDKAVRDVPLDGRIKQENLQKELVRDQIF